MSQSDWTIFPASLPEATVDRGVTNGQTPPSGGGSWVYGWHSLLPDLGAVGKYMSSDVAFAPAARGGSIRGAMRRLSAVDAAPMFMLSLQSPDVGAEGYLIGLAHDENPSRLVIVKGTPAAGLSIANAVANSTGTYQPGNWLHLRFDVIRQPSDDVLLKVYENDLGTNPVTSPVWVLVPGLEAVVDDALGINLGSQPYLGGYCAVAYYSGAVGRYAFIDHIEIFRQT
jgi:hypothetical protein